MNSWPADKKLTFGKLKRIAVYGWVAASSFVFSNAWRRGGFFSSGLFLAATVYTIWLTSIEPAGEVPNPSNPEAIAMTDSPATSNNQSPMPFFKAIFEAVGVRFRSK